MFRRYMNWIKKNRWQFIFYMLVLLLFLGVVYFLYLGFSFYRLKITQENLTNKIKRIKVEINDYKSKEEVKKYLLVSKLNQKLKPTKRSYVMQQLLNIYLTVNRMGNFKIENFNISLNNLKLDGIVKDLALVYKSGGILDQFQKLPFIEKINIPIYSRQQNGFKFNLNAKITIYNVGKSN